MKNEADESVRINQRVLLISDFTKKKFWTRINTTENNISINNVNEYHFAQKTTDGAKHKRL